MENLKTYETRTEAILYGILNPITYSRIHEQLEGLQYPVVPLSDFDVPAIADAVIVENRDGYALNPKLTNVEYWKIVKQNKRKCVEERKPGYMTTAPLTVEID